ncbi:hypothetical protein [Engelhardtia mirabilis]|uniref:hypothetical protein n=1 Tax=Engelhardtia mirabilis TaxID=2528011 RepID=UPI00119F34D0
MIGPVEPGTTGLVIELSRGRRIAGRATLPGAEAGRAAKVILYRSPLDPEQPDVPDGRVFVAATDVNGAFDLDGVSPGAWLAHVRPQGPPSRHVGWPPDQRRPQPLPFVVDVPAQGRFAGAVTEIAGEPCILRGQLGSDESTPLGLAELLLVGDRALQVDSCTIDERGIFELAVREPGRYRLVLHRGPHRDYRSVFHDLVELSEGENAWTRWLSVADWPREGLRFDESDPSSPEVQWRSR